MKYHDVLIVCYGCPCDFPFWVSDWMFVQAMSLTPDWQET